ncbi:hypothetical protein E4V42_17840 [Clostridium estertheticum]|uniref:Glycosyltransferase RgtA/B/C/D-like domain-containing protein n=1 Tax=Clostridium estertheticum TaxID=238834 RepID=A0A5N7ISP5_9CLOT|nr:hypothetical protein [Clostridium estertheticum]MPQ33286.1 hypothetical protein [Clostridium estertheticum]MPQ63944.1 hypothetical protein [Clostridium estertheticum]
MLLNIKRTLLILFVVTIISFLSIFKQMGLGSEWIEIIGITSFFIVTLFLISNNKDKKLTQFMLTGFLLRFGLAIIQTYLYNLPDSTSDAVSFELVGYEMSLHGSIVYIISNSTEAYTKLIAIVYLFLGRIPIFLLLINVFLGVLLIKISYKIVLQMNGTYKQARIASLIISIYPMLNLYSAISRREMFNIVFFALSFLYFLKWMSTLRNKEMLKAVSCILISAVFHSATAFVLFIYIFTYLFYKNKNLKYKFRKPGTKIIVILAVTVIVVLTFNLVTKKVSSIQSFSPQGLTNFLINCPIGRGNYLSTLYPISFFDIIWQTPIRIFYFCFGPFSTNILDIFSILFDSIFFIIFSIIILKNYTKVIINRKSQIVTALMVITTILVVFSWGTVNFGTAIRHRQTISWLLICITSLCYKRPNK